MTNDIYHTVLNTPWNWTNTSVHFDMTTAGTSHNAQLAAYNNKNIRLIPASQSLYPSFDKSSQGVLASPRPASSASIRFSPQSGEYFAFVDIDTTITFPQSWSVFLGFPITVDFSFVADFEDGDSAAPDPNSIVLDVDASEMCSGVLSMANLFRFDSGVARISSRLCGIFKGYSLRLGFRYTAVWVSGTSKSLKATYFHNLVVTGFHSVVSGVMPTESEPSIEDEISDAMRPLTS